jgi:thiamine pyrophosphokinase
MSCAVFLNGEYEDDTYYLRAREKASLVVAADGGHAFLRRHGLWPDLLVGDFDSLDEDLVREAREADIEMLRRPVRKDKTDGELAVAEACARTPDEIVLLGALGGDLDHLLGHVSVLRGLSQTGRAARIASPRLAVRVFHGPHQVTLGAPIGTRVSLISLSPNAVVTLRGLEYPVTNAPLPATSCLGVSNAVAAPEARIALAAGVLAVLVFDGDETFIGKPER